MFSKAIVVAAAIAGVAAFPHEKRQGVTALISPSAPAPSGCLLTDPEMFGIAAMAVEYPIPTTYAVERKMVKRNMFDIRQIVTQISDAQPQAPTATIIPITQISDAQPQAPTATVVPITQISDAQPQAPTATVVPITQISDAQPQAPTQTVVPITQISDAQPQAPTATVSTMMHSAITQISDGQVQAFHATTVIPITQISDAQPQAPTATAVPVTQISDAQPQAPTATAAPVTQISDAQPQAPTATAAPVTQISDAQPQAPSASTATGTAISQQSDAQPTAGDVATATASATAATPPQPMVSMVACDGPGTLSLNLTNGRLLDGQGRVGYIASNFQFQFDPDVPQAGAIITAGFSICSNGSLALGGSTIFWRCLSGSFYNLYDRYWAAQCSPINLVAVGLLQPGEGGCPA